MGIFDFFKKKPEIKKESVSFDELDSFIKNKKQEFGNSKSVFDSKIKQRLSLFISQLEEKTIILEKIDLKNVRADERAKFIVRENLDKYIINLDKLIENLENIREDSKSENVAGNIAEKINNFEKRSFMHYEKATFLIGKELGAVKDSISIFVKDMNNIILEHQEPINSYDQLSSTGEKLKRIKEIEELREKINDSILKNIKELSSFEKQKNINESEIEKLRNSKEYIDEIEKNMKFEDKRKEFEKTLYELKQMIDFKALANLFHYDPKKMSIINEHNHNFNQLFMNDNGLRLVKLLEESGKNNHNIIQKINSIIEKRRDIENKEDYIDNTYAEKISFLGENIKRINQNSAELNEVNSKEKKKSEKLEENKREIINEIKEELLKMNIVLIKDEYSQRL